MTAACVTAVPLHGGVTLKCGNDTTWSSATTWNSATTWSSAIPRNSELYALPLLRCVPRKQWGSNGPAVTRTWLFTLYLISATVTLCYSTQELEGVQLRERNSLVVFDPLNPRVCNIYIYTTCFKTKHMTHPSALIKVMTHPSARVH